MNKKKFLSIVLSLALVLSMTSAFTSVTYANNQNVLKTGTYASKVPSKVVVDGVTLNSGEYINIEHSENSVKGIPNSKDGYAYYKDGSLTLHNFVLENVSEHDAVIVKPDNESGFYELNIVIDGDNKLAISENDENSSSAINAPGVKLVISEKSRNSTLILKTNDSLDGAEDGIDCILADGFELNSGKVTITAGTCFDFEKLWADTGLATDKDDAIINGGELNITSAAVGIYTEGSFKLYGGSVNIGSTNGNKNTNYCAICTNFSTIINGGKLSINKFFGCGIYAGKSIFVQNGTVAICDVGSSTFDNDSAAIYADSTFDMTGGSVIIKELKGFADGISASNVKIGGGFVSINGDYHGVYSINDTNISGGTIKINAKQSGIYAKKGAVQITDAVVDISAYCDCVFAKKGSTVKNSDVKLLSNGTNLKYMAFYPTVTVLGKPAVYAGSSSINAKRISDVNKIDNYRYVHIYKYSNIALSRINTIFTNLITAIFGVNSASVFADTKLFKLLANILNI